MSELDILYRMRGGQGAFIDGLKELIGEASRGETAVDERFGAPDRVFSDTPWMVRLEISLGDSAAPPRQHLPCPDGKLFRENGSLSGRSQRGLSFSGLCLFSPMAPHLLLHSVLYQLSQ